VEVPPLPLAPSGSVRVADGVAFLEDESGCGSVFIWGMVPWCWQGGDVVARRLAAVQLAESEAEHRQERTCALEALAVPPLRAGEPVAARFGLLGEAPPVICEGASLPLAGALLILPAFVATGLLETAAGVYGVRQRAFHGLRSLLLTIVFCCVLGEPRAEGLTRTDPVDLGRLLGLDRAPEVRTLRRRTEELAGTNRSAQLGDALARHHLDAHEVAAGILSVDGHVRAFHGGRELLQGPRGPHSPGHARRAGHLGL